MGVKGYKGFEADMTCRGFQYEVGKTYEMDGKIEPCERGFHFCLTMAQAFGYYNGNDKRYAEVEAIGTVKEDGDKCVTDKIRIVREIPHDEAVQMTNTGDMNTGNRNTGNRNTGDWNTGNMNTGDWNTGDWNTGDWNTGNMNTGNRNTGDWNTGDWNTGNMNTGNRNTGNRNTGDMNTGNRNTGNRNTGNMNTGNRNTGNRNTGNRNTGDWNKTNYSSGCFCTEPDKIRMFNRPSDWTLNDWRESDARHILSHMPHDIDIIEWIPDYKMTDKEKDDHPSYKTTGGYLKVSKSNADKQAWWDGLSKYDKETVKALPNFDAEIFRKCTGITVYK